MNVERNLLNVRMISSEGLCFVTSSNTGMLKMLIKPDMQKIEHQGEVGAFDKDEKEKAT
jgi:hypothetical protein